MTAQVAAGQTTSNAPGGQQAIGGWAQVTSDIPTGVHVEIPRRRSMTDRASGGKRAGAINPSFCLQTDKSNKSQGSRFLDHQSARNCNKGLGERRKSPWTFSPYTRTYLIWHKVPSGCYIYFNEFISSLHFCQTVVSTVFYASAFQHCFPAVSVVKIEVR